MNVEVKTITLPPLRVPLSVNVLPCDTKWWQERVRLWECRMAGFDLCLDCLMILGKGDRSQPLKVWQVAA